MDSNQRQKFFPVVFLVLMAAVIARLYYWQIIRGDELSQVAQAQAKKRISATGKRGNIYTSDNYLLATNVPYYQLNFSLEKLDRSAIELKRQLLPILENDALFAKEKIEEMLENNLERKEANSKLWPKVSEKAKQEIEALHVPSITYTTIDGRFYPEASMAAHVLGFVGKNNDGEDTGYFGIEGALNDELSGQKSAKLVRNDAFSEFLSSLSLTKPKIQRGRDIVLTIRRDLQFLAESYLKKGMEKYGASEGEIIIIEPATGKIRALAAYPNYEPLRFNDYPAEYYKNPSLIDLYEPGSTFKTLTVSTGIDVGAIEPDTICTSCSGPRAIGKYTIRTWNDAYNPNISMTDALTKSDNVAMIFASELIGKDNFVSYIKKFGIGDLIKIDLQEDTETPLGDKWGPIELATSSFGQGITTTSMQLIRAVNSIANKGKMMRPQIVEKVIDQTNNKEIVVEPIVERQVLKEETAKKVTEMMISSAVHGEAQWTVSKHYTVAGKTGTSQIPKEGGYEEDKTIASFIGFAPPSDPKFLMLVKLREPQSSPWAAETAAPLWFDLAGKLFLLFDVMPDK